MEITSKLHQFNFNFNFSSHNPKTHLRHVCFSGKSSTIRPPLPLHKRPHRKTIQPINNPPTKPPSTTATTTTTSSDVLRLLDCLGFPVPDSLYISLIKECTHFQDAQEAVFLHEHLTRNRRNRPRLPLLNLTLIMFVSCGCLQNARQVFDEMPRRDFNTWAIMIAAYTDIGDYDEVIRLFIDSKLQCLIDNSIKFPASWVLVCVLKACANTLNLKLGQQIHCGLLKSGYSDDLFVSSSLINFYGKIGCFDGGDSVFDQISGRRNVVVWTARITNNCKKERFDEVLDVFNEMGKEGIRKNSFTLSGVLSACSKISDDGNCGEQVHAHAIKSGLASKSYVQCGLVNMYGKFGLIQDAKRVFYMNERMQNDACWNAMLSSFIQHGCHVEAIKFVYHMKAAGVQPQELWLNRLRSLCGSKDLDIE